MESSSSADAELHARIRQQEVAAELGQRALKTDDLDQLLRDATVAVAETLDAEYCDVFELLPGRDELVLRAGVGWREGLTGTATVPAERDSQAGFTLADEEPVIVGNLRNEQRFSGSDLLTERGVVSGISVVIGSVENPWGVLGAHTKTRREFTEHEANFVRSVANVLASAIENRRTKHELDEIYGRISDAFFALDEEWRFTHLNERAHELINPDGQPLIGEHIWETFPDALGRKFETKYKRAMYEQETVSFEEYYPAPLDAWFEVRAYPSATGLSVYFRNVTERKVRERELQMTERRFEAIFEDPNILVGLLDPDGTVLTVNRTAMEYIDADHDEVTGKPFWEAPWWSEDDEVGDDVREWTERAAAGEYVDFTADLTRPDGERYTLEGFFRPVTNDDGDVVSVIVSDRDVTERKRRERALEQSEQRYRTLAESFPNGLVTLFDGDLRYTLAAGRAFDYLPVSSADIEDRTPREAWGDGVADSLEPLLRAALHGETGSVEVSYAGREWVVHGVPITDENGDIFVGMSMAQDITEQKKQEQNLREAKSQLEAATEAGAVGTWEWDVQRDEMVVGPSFAETFDVDPEAAHEGVSLDQFISAIHEDDRARVVAQVEDAVESDGEYESEYRVWNADGELQWVVARGSVKYDDAGNPVTFPGALTDITERKRTELELQRNKNQLESLFEVLPIGVVVADADGRLVEANDTAKEIWGGDVFDAESVEEYSRLPAVWADSKEPVECDEWTMTRVLTGEEVTEPNVFEIETLDGERRIISAKGMPVKGADGTVTRGVVTIMDVTERRENQRRLEESERRYRTLAKNFPNGAVGLFDENLRYTAAGGQFLKATGVDPEDRIGHSILDLYPDELVEVVEPHFRAALDGETASFEVEHSGHNLFAHTLPVRDADDEVFAGMLVVQDVTERQEYERKLEASNERLEQFAYAASHDLQEPLRMISSYLQLIERRYAEQLDEDGREFLEFAVDGADRMREMIDGLLKYSRVDTRGDPFEPVELDDVLADVRDDLKMKIAESNAEITAGSLPRVEGDEGQLRMVLQNLLDNGIKYSGDNPPRMTISAERANSKWIISVSDEGIGIDPADADRVFEVFQRLHTQDEHDGTGIGLALVERIVERHGGDIWIEPAVDEGTTISFTLPAFGGHDA